MQSARYYCPILSKFGIARLIFVSVPNIRFHENSPKGSSADRCDGTNRQTEHKTKITDFFAIYKNASNEEVVNKP